MSVIRPTSARSILAMLSLNSIMDVDDKAHIITAAGKAVENFLPV
jgi:hypothetical protein